MSISTVIFDSCFSGLVIHAAKLPFSETDSVYTARKWRDHFLALLPMLNFTPVILIFANLIGRFF